MTSSRSNLDKRDYSVLKFCAKSIQKYHQTAHADLLYPDNLERPIVSADLGLEVAAQKKLFQFEVIKCLCLEATGRTSARI